MSRYVAMLLVLVFLTALCAVTPMPAKADSRAIIVPDHYPTITAALLAATNGDTILVKKGIYEEHTLMINKTITLTGEDANMTIIKNIDESPSWDPSLYPFPPSKPDAVQINADNVKISGFTITSTSKGIYAIGNGTKIIGNIIKELYNPGYIMTTGIETNGEEAQIIGNTVLGATVGISVSGSYHIIAQNTIEGGRYCITTSGQYNVVASNIVSKGSYGITLSDTSSIVYDNIVTDLHEGITVHGVGNIVYKNNASYNSLTGIKISVPISDYGNNLVCANTITNNEGQGIYVVEGRNNTLRANYIGDNQLGAQVLWYQGPLEVKDMRSAFDNTFYHNNFVGNSRGAIDWSWQGTNAWDNGAEGNYWSDYNGTDADSDGIGDIFYDFNFPYSVDSAAGLSVDPKAVNVKEVFDRYPLMAPFDIDSVAVQLPAWASLDFELEQAITVLSPQNTTYTTGDVPLNFTVPKWTTWVRYSLDGQDNVTITGNTTLTGLANGAHSLTLYADDLFENTIVSETIHFTIEVPEPFPQSLVVTLAIMVAVVAVGFLIYFKKNRH